MTGIVLASSSAIRLQILLNAGVAARAIGHRVDEGALQRDRTVSSRDLARRLATAKAQSVAVEPHNVVIGADQTLELAGETLTKPADRNEARRQLRRLSGRTHALHSAFAVAARGRIVGRGTRMARLRMRALDDAAIEAYLDRAGAAATQSVGAYQIEGLGIQLFDRIDGDYFTILGLPMLPLLAVLRRIGALPR